MQCLGHGGIRIQRPGSGWIGFTCSWATSLGKYLRIQGTISIGATPVHPRIKQMGGLTLRERGDLGYDGALQPQARQGAADDPRGQRDVLHTHAKEHK